MLLIEAENAVTAWKKALVTLLRDGDETDNSKYFRDEPALIELSNPSIEPADPLFPMTQKDLDIINRFIFTGEKEDQVCHEWTRIYYHRMFDEPNSQVRYLIEKLQLDEPTGEAQMSMWDKSVDQKREISPCIQIVWGRKRGGSLELHVHAHSCDAYGKLLMNLQEFISLQHYLASELGLKVGRYLHFLDSCHVHTEDVDAAEALVTRFAATELAS